MNHLKVEEMIDFVSFNEFNDEFLSLASKVNTHTLRCKECREKVSAFQKIYDELSVIGRSGEFKKTALKEQNVNKTEEKKNNNSLDNGLDR